MRTMKWFLFAAVLAAGLWACLADRADARGYRQYYGGWSYYPARTYYYRYYYYKPYDSYEGYSYHYAIYYPSQPRYVYYYNPYSGYYWGRYDTQAKGDDKYSLLKPEDRKKNIDDIPEKAFPKPGPMPSIPESKDGAKIEPPPDDLPKK
jgi:hypothetical protein